LAGLVETAGCRPRAGTSSTEAPALADEEVSGRKCHVYQIKGLAEPLWIGGNQFTLWADAKTGLPVKIRAGDEHTSLTFEDFKWNEPIKEEMFSLEIPKGYTLEKLSPAVVASNRIYYQQGSTELHSIQPDGEKPGVQFTPRLPDSPETYDSAKAELSPDGRYLAMAYSHVTDHGAFPPYRVLLWDRTHPKTTAVEVYARPEGELQSWRFSPDGKRIAYTCRLLDPKNPPFNYGAETYLKLVDADGGNTSILLTKKVKEG
jgi:hypothetical protein